MADNKVSITLSLDSGNVKQGADEAIKAIGGIANEAKKISAPDAASWKTFAADVAHVGGAFAVIASAAQPAMAAVDALAGYLKESALSAARFETLGVTLQVVGRNAGYSAGEMMKYAEGVRSMGITMLESRESVLRMAQAQLDLSKSTELARVAQDAAVIGGINSSEALKAMVYGIQSGQIEVLRTIGINVNFEQSYQKLALSLGKSTEALSEQEKAIARQNTVLEAGKNIAGAYEAAMGTAGKQLNSIARYSEDAKVKLGEVFNESLLLAVGLYTDKLKASNAELDKLSKEGSLADFGKDITNAFAAAADGAKPFTQALDTAYTALLQLQGLILNSKGDPVGAAGAAYLQRTRDRWGSSAQNDLAAFREQQKLDARTSKGIGGAADEQYSSPEAKARAEGTTAWLTGNKNAAEKATAEADASFAKLIAATKTTSQKVRDEIAQLDAALKAGSAKSTEEVAKVRANLNKKLNDALTQEGSGAAGLLKEQYTSRLDAIKTGLQMEESSIALSLAKREIDEKTALDRSVSAEQTSYAKRIEILNRQLAATSSPKDREVIVRQINEVADAAVVAANKETAAYAKLEDQVRKAMEAMAGDAWKQAGAAQADLEKLKEEYTTLGMTTEQLNAYRIEKLKAASESAFRDALAMDTAAELLAAEGDDTRAESLRNMAAARRELAATVGKEVDVMGSLQIKTAAVKASDDASKAWQKFSDDIERSLTDALMRSFESGNSFGETFVKSLQNTIKAAVLKMAIQVVLDPITGKGGILQAGAQALGIAGSTGGTGGAAGSAGNLISGGSSLYNAATGGVPGWYSGFANSGIGASLGLSASSFALPTTAIASVPTAFGAMSVPATTGIAGSAGMTALGESIGAAIPYVGIAIAVASLLGGAFGDKEAVPHFHLAQQGMDPREGTSNWGKPTGLSGGNTVVSPFSYLVAGAQHVGGNEQAYADNLANQYLKPIGEADKILASMMTSAEVLRAIAAVQPTGTLSNNQVSDPAQFTAILTDRLHLITSSIGGWVSDLAATTTGDLQTVYGQVAAILSMRASEGAQSIAEGLLGETSNQFLKSGETAATGFFRLISSLDGVNSILDDLGYTTLALSLAGASSADNLITAFGGLDKYQASAQAYYDGYYTQAEKIDILRTQLTSAFADLDVAMPTTRAGFRALVDGAYAMGDAGLETYVGLMNIQGAFGTLADSLYAVDDAAIAAAATLRQSWQDKVDVLQGTTTDRQLSLQRDLASTTDTATQALIRLVYSLEDTSAAATLRQSWQDKVDVLQGTTTDRQLSLQRDLASTTDTATQALIRLVYSLEDTKTAADIAAQVASEGVAFMNNRYGEWANTSQANTSQEIAPPAVVDVSGRENWQSRLNVLQGTQTERDVSLSRDLASTTDLATKSLIQLVYALEDTATATKATADFDRAMLEAAGNTSGLKAFDRAAQLAAATSVLASDRLQAIFDAQDIAATAKATQDFTRSMLEVTGNTSGLKAFDRSMERSNLLLKSWTDTQIDSIFIAKDAAEAAAKALQIANSALSIRAQIAELSGDTAGATQIKAAQRANELVGLDSYLATLTQTLWDLQDAAEAAAKALQIANSTLSLRAQIAELSGDTAGATQIKAAQRANELAATDPALRTLTQELWDMQDAAAATAASVKLATDNLALQAQLAELRGDTGMSASVLLQQQQATLAGITDPTQRNLQQSVFDEQILAKLSTATKAYTRAMLEISGDASGLRAFDLAAETATRVLDGWTAAQISAFTAARNTAEVAKATQDYNRAILDATGNTSGLKTFDRALERSRMSLEHWTDTQITTLFSAQDARSGTDTSLAALSKSIDKEKARVSASYDEQIRIAESRKAGIAESYAGRIKTSNDTLSALSSIGDKIFIRHAANQNRAAHLTNAHGAPVGTAIHPPLTLS
jgi:hypothetical protein